MKTKWKRQTSSTQRKNFKTQVTQNRIRKEQISTPRISTKAQRFPLQKPSNNRSAKCQQKPARPRAAEFHGLHRFENIRQQFQSVRFSLSNWHANVQGSRAWAETPCPLQDTRSSKTSCNKLSTITKLNNKEPEEDTPKYYRKNSTISLPRISTRQGN